MDNYQDPLLNRDYPAPPIKVVNPLMKIEKGLVVTIEYCLKDEQGKVWESSENSEPWVYLHGFGGIIPGLEPELDGKEAGDQVIVKLQPEQAYGDYEQERINQVPKEMLDGIKNLEVGMRLEATTDTGEPIGVKVIEIKDDYVTIDANHPLAGQTVTVEVTVTEIRPALPDELEHGHPHTHGSCH
ncbi:peptidylprolyl isomerase [Pleionea sp. CnH1-48]|uniref:FKBP-type peptidyl-prolyl cis-trans isomerase n=1 Tax=Pleionea sp. CnH1-48 TaxID=2954494 RepID=UPI002096CC79|nr:peptidylprolyl isomerase [Pleionea sp. CnH1-48]MCO7224599.1 peptidylprolyl isomerase [Pleionea sp. CnH1-48]